MPLKNAMENLNMRFLLKAAAAWAVTAVILLLLSSFVVSRSSIGAGSIGYISSALSFLTACAAGAGAARSCKKGGIYIGLISATAITAVLLTIGFIVQGAGIEASAVLSVVTFTFSGCLVGSVFFGGHTGKGRKGKFMSKPRR